MPLDHLDPVAAARLHFAATMTFHILFPAINMGLAWVLLYFKLRYARTGREYWLEAFRYWVKVFAVSFATGVVSGVAMSLQFRASWPGFMEAVGPIASPLMTSEIVTAFLIQATFLAVMLFGLNRISDRAHTLATGVVAVGTTLSAFWILALSSWMHTPAGFEMIDGRARPTDWLAVIFNPSFPYRFTHVLLASALTAAFLVAGISAYRWRRGDRQPDVEQAMKTGIRLAATLIPLQILAGNLHGANTLEHQPAKLAAMQGLWETQRGVPAVLFAVPDQKARENRHALSIPKLASLALGRSPDAEVKGLNDFQGQHPPVAPVFWSFRIMVAIAFLMLGVSWLAAWQLRRNGLPGRRVLFSLVLMTFAGWFALVAGWYTTEIGRQPWLVQGVLSAACAASGIPPSRLGIHLSTYLVVYSVALLAFVAFLFHLARQASARNAARIPADPYIVADVGGHA